ncbi:histone-fold-containing protein [Fimicolochytrium jonesii]|uniref:histone-fold-containing protein n=1 Tax=Fimicolochytrium jonesii TaxID=1396493 RepID=UPI0022FEEEAD|nr:histone-fold-containing protein [Fimicolochytrium jonesii]KAI8817040.1 histone-fold-containing protein [Fimicolochytrium jonesii]
MTSIEDIDLPRSIISRVIKGALPDGAQVQKDAKAAMTKACTVFISYLTATALDVTKSNDRKSITSNDVFRALTILEFDQFAPMIKVAVQEFQQKAKEKRQEYKRNFKARTTTSAGNRSQDPDDNPSDSDGDDDGDAEEPMTNQQMLENGATSKREYGQIGDGGSLEEPEAGNKRRK